MTKDDFFQAVEYQGFEGAVLQLGDVVIENEPEMTTKWAKFVDLYHDLDDSYTEWEGGQIES